MLHPTRTWQVSDWNLPPENMAEIAKESGWNFCLCQAFHLVIDGREIYLLNDSITPDPIRNYQEYAAVVVTKKVECGPGYWVCQGHQVESLTVNAGQTPVLDLLRHLGDPTLDMQDAFGDVAFALESGDRHLCDHCT